MRTRMRRGTIVIALVVAGSGLNVLGAVSAFASCPSDYGWAITGRTDAWMLTNTTSNWLTGPGSISYTTSATTTRSTVQGTHIGVSVSWLLASAHAEYSATWSSSTTKTTTWSYSISIPKGQTARAAVYKRGSRFSVQHYTDYANCTESWGPVYYNYSPFAATDTSQYCIGKDPTPGTTYVFASGCGH